MKERVSILGCGWLGLPLAAFLVGKGFQIKGSTTSKENFEELTSEGVAPFAVKITDVEIISDDITGFLDSEVLVINFPPQRRPDIEEYHQAQFRHLIEAIAKSPVKKVLFASSTSVYPDLNRQVFETETEAPEKGSGKALKIVEQMLFGESSFKTTVVRFAGLIGDDRMPGRFLAGKQNVENGDAPVNLIHRDDCLQIIYRIIENDVWGDVFNACMDEHPTRKEYYIKAAEAIGMTPPTFAVTEVTKFKIINSEKLKRTLGYTFKFVNPLDLLTL